MIKTNIQVVNSVWNSRYKEDKEEKEEKEEKEDLKMRRVTFLDDEMKANAQCECTCNTPSESLTCLLHDGSNPRKRVFYDMIVAYFSKYTTFCEKDVITQAGDIDTIALCIEEAKDILKRLEKRKRDIFESDLYDFYIKKSLKKRLNKSLESVPRVALMDDYDSKWDSLYWNMASKKKQIKCTKVSLVKGGARGVDATLEYNNIPFVKKLEKLLENAHESMFLDFI